MILWAISIIACPLLAKNKNRSVTEAFAAGVLFGVFALVYYICVGKRQW